LRHDPQDKKQGFTGEDLIRFFDTMLGVVIPRSKSKPAPSARTIMDAIHICLSYGVFQYNMPWTKQEMARLKVWFDNAKAAGRMTTGIWEKRVRIGFTTLSKIGLKWLQYNLDHGCLNWDVPIYQLMSIALMSALNCRAGDIGRSALYTALEYLSWRDIRILVDESAPNNHDDDLFLPSSASEHRNERESVGLVISGFTARFELRFRKAEKTERNVDGVIHLSTLNSSHHQQICPITLLLVHAMRHELVRGKSLEEVATIAQQSPSKEVQWLKPDAPVLTAINISPKCSLDLSHPASTRQLNDTLKRMGLVAGLLSRVYTHAIRAGAARDIAHLTTKQTSGKTLGLGTARNALGHTHNALSNGVTELYTGEETLAYFNARAAREYTDRWGPKFTDESLHDFVTAPVTKEEISLWQAEHEPTLNPEDASKSSAVRRARRHIRTAREEYMRTHAKTAAVDSVPQALQFPQQTSHTDSIDPSLLHPRMTPISQQQQPPPPLVGMSSDTVVASAQTSEISITNSDIIDPALLQPTTPNSRRNSMDNDLVEENFGEMDIDATTIDSTAFLAFEDTVVPNHSALDTTVDDDDDDDELLDALTDVCEGAMMSMEHASYMVDFVTRFSKINIVRQDTFGKKWASYVKSQQYETTIGPHSMRGGTRDSPTPYMYLCRETEGCPAKFHTYRGLSKHELYCSPTKVAKVKKNQEKDRSFVCTFDGCTSAFRLKGSLTSHVKTQHNWLPKACPSEACDKSILYDSYNELREHKRHHGFPTTCLAASAASPCSLPEGHLFNDSSTHEAHLRTIHNIPTSNLVAYRPAFPGVKRRRHGSTLDVGEPDISVPASRKKARKAVEVV
jgi:hypothetical protein